MEDNLIEGGLAMLLGVVMIIVMSGFIVLAQTDPNVTGVPGLTLIISLIVYVFAFAVIIKGYKIAKA